MSKPTLKSLATLFFGIVLGFGAWADVDLSKYQPKPFVELSHPEWAKNASIYEVNIRQFTPEGNFKAFAKHLPRLKELGVDILWLMPIHPIGEKNRKGSKGSYYSVQDYFGVNPEFGTMEEFKALVKQIHEMGMYVILDWVGNHSAWDHPLTKTNPDWYTRTIDGNFQPTPWWDWSDVIDFDYNVPEMRAYMTKALRFWVEEANIDGYRADVAGFMPTDFWEQVYYELNAIKPVFMLAEWESRDIHKKAFNMSYSWELYNVLHEVAHGHGDAMKVRNYFAHLLNSWPENAIKMNFVDNHDKNSWDGTPFTQFKDALDVSMVTTVLAEGMPLIYSGQEAGLDKQLAFFEKDLIEWKEHRYFGLYQSLLQLKKQNQALWNGNWGGSMIPVENNNSQQVFSFYREKNGNKVLTVLNFSDKAAKVKFTDSFHYGQYTDWFSQASLKFGKATELTLPAWGYQVFTAD